MKTSSPQKPLLNGLKRPLTAFEPPVKAGKSIAGATNQVFQDAVALVLRHEGGYVNDPSDAGGETKFGISQKSYPDLKIASITIEQAVDIYLNDFWFRYRYHQIPFRGLAIKLFDIAVNIGPRSANKLLQRAINKVRGAVVALDVDGVVGPVTQGALAQCEGSSLLAEFFCQAWGYYKTVSVAGDNKKFLVGWMNRLTDF
jgi:lysozyme family protein